MAKHEIIRTLQNMYMMKAIQFCNETVLSYPPPDDDLYCPALIDNWGLCFNYTKAGTTAYVPCPLIIFPKSKGMTYRRCESDGNWQVFKSGLPWTNMSECTKNETLPHKDFDKSVSYVYLYIALSAVSIFMLTISLVIFYGFRQLRCDRITIHKNLFISYIISAVTCILYYRLAVLEGTVILENPTWCQLLHVLMHGFTATNFSWMFCEGLYLHVILAHALRTSKKLIKCLVVGGWVVPIVITVIYGTTRWAVGHQTSSCWIREDVLQWIIGAPISVSVLVNICILVNLVWLLMTKLKQIPDASQSQKAAKATLILVPLFGLQFLLFPLRPDFDSNFYVAYLHVMAFLHSSQGIFVSIILCFCNGEVRSLLHQMHNQLKNKSDDRSKTNRGTTVTVMESYSMVENTRDGPAKEPLDNHYKQTDAMEGRKNPAAVTPLIPKDNCTEKDSSITDD